MTVKTGHLNNSETKSNIYFVLSGSKGYTKVRRLHLENCAMQKGRDFHNKPMTNIRNFFPLNEVYHNSLMDVKIVLTIALTFSRLSRCNSSITQLLRFQPLM